MADRTETFDAVEGTLERLADVDDLESIADDELEALVENLGAFGDLLEETEDLLEAIDFADLPEAVDGDELLEAIELGEIPDTIADDEGDDVVEVRQLVQAIELTKLWGATDLGDLWETKRDLEETADDLTDDGGEGDDGLVESAASAVTGDDEGALDDDSAVAEAGEAVTDEMADEFGSLSPGDGDEFGLDARDTQAYQTMIQQKAIEGIDEFREALLTTHGTFQELYEFNRERMRQTDKPTNSRNPTAVSTIPLERADVPSTSRYATMPRTVRHSSGPTRKHIYGARFERELEKRRDSASNARSGSSAQSGGER